MKSIKNLLFGNLGGHFDRYYAGVLRPGAGYPTADEARQDLHARDRVAASSCGWFR